MYFCSLDDFKPNRFQEIYKLINLKTKELKRTDLIKIDIIDRKHLCRLFDIDMMRPPIDFGLCIDQITGLDIIIE